MVVPLGCLASDHSFSHGLTSCRPPPPNPTGRTSSYRTLDWPGPGRWRMLALLLPLMWAGSLQDDPGFHLQVPKSVTVQEGLCALVNCSFSYPESWGYYNRPLYISWFWERDNIFYDDPVATNKPKTAVKPETKGRFHLIGNAEAKNCSLMITGARRTDDWRTDDRTYFLHIDKGQKYSYREKLTLTVTGLTEKPIVHMEETLQAGRPAHLSCSLPGSCPGGQPVSFSWMGDIISFMDPGTLHSSGLTLTPRPQDHDTNITCQVKLRGSQQTTERTVQLSVSYAPQNLSISLSFSNGTVLRILHGGLSVPVMEGQSLHMVCEADSNPPASLSWFQMGKTKGRSQMSASGVLELPRVGADHGGEFICQAQHPLGSQHLSLSLSEQKSSCSCLCTAEKQEGSWPLVLTLIRGTLMGAGFLLTYGLTWVYYTRYAALRPKKGKPP